MTPFPLLFARFFLSALCLPLLAGCVSATFGNHDDIEMFPLRSATESEGRQLKQCLRAARSAQLSRQRQTGHFARKMGELNIDSSCQGLRLRQQGTQAGYEILAEKREDENTVRWSINEKGVIEEHLDVASEGGELESL